MLSKMTWMHTEYQEERERVEEHYYYHYKEVGYKRGRRRAIIKLALHMMSPLCIVTCHNMGVVLMEPPLENNNDWWPCTMLLYMYCRKSESHAVSMLYKNSNEHQCVRVFLWHNNSIEMSNVFSSWVLSKKIMSAFTFSYVGADDIRHARY